MYILTHFFKNTEEVENYRKKTIGKRNFRRGVVNPPCIVLEFINDHDEGVGVAQISKTDILQLLS